MNYNTLTHTPAKYPIQDICRVKVDLYGSLALTGVGHATDRAIILGLLDERPDEVNIALIEPIIKQVKQSKKIQFAAKKEIDFDITAAQLALTRHTQRVSLDQVIKTMYQTGKDMSDNYKETSLGGLAASVTVEEDDTSTVPYRIRRSQVAC